MTNMNIYVLLPFASFIITFILGVYIYSKYIRDQTNTLFVLLCLSISVWSFAVFQARQADAIKTAELWLKIYAFWPLAMSILLHFILYFTEHSKIFKHRLFYALIYLPAIFFIILSLTTNLVLGEPIKESWGWTYDIPENSIILPLIPIWAGIMGFGSILLCVFYYYKIENREKKLQTIYLSVGLLIPVILGFTTEGLPILFQIKIPELTTVGYAIGCIIIGFAIQKYELFILTPRSQITEQK